MLNLSKINLALKIDISTAKRTDQPATHNKNAEKTIRISTK